MYNTVNVLLFGVAVLLAGGAISQGAKPLGALPYRWATFVGVCSSFYAVVAAVSLFYAHGAYQVMAVVALGGLSALSFGGLLARKRFGAAAFLLLLAVVQIDHQWNQPRQSMLLETIQVILNLSAWGVNFVYFRKRWRFLD